MSTPPLTAGEAYNRRARGEPDPAVDPLAIAERLTAGVVAISESMQTEDGYLSAVITGRGKVATSHLDAAAHWALVSIAADLRRIADHLAGA